ETLVDHQVDVGENALDRLVGVHNLDLDRQVHRDVDDLRGDDATGSREPRHRSHDGSTGEPLSEEELDDRAVDGLSTPVRGLAQINRELLRLPPREHQPPPKMRRAKAAPPKIASTAQTTLPAVFSSTKTTSPPSRSLAVSYAKVENVV